MAAAPAPKTRKVKAEIDGDGEDSPARFVQPHIPDSEARERWPLRYRGKVIGILSRKSYLGLFCLASL